MQIISQQKQGTANSHQEEIRQTDMRHDGGTPGVHLSHHGAREPNRNFQIIQEVKFAPHVIFQIHFERRQEEPTPPRVFPQSTGPSARSTYISLAIVEEWHDVRVGLSGNEKPTIEHFC